MIPPAPPTGESGTGVERPDGAPASLAARVRSRRLYLVWATLAVVAASGFWAQSRGSGLAGFAVAFTYLALCCAALFLPGLVLAATGLPIERQRTIALGVLIVATGLVAGTILASFLWVTTPLILLTGNAIWTLDTIDLALEARKRDAGGPGV